MAGIRPKLNEPGGEIRDFVINHEDRRGLAGLINLIGIESPGLTSCMAIGEYVKNMIKESGLLDFIELTKTCIKDFHVRTNADKPRDAELARTFGAEGIGLCRTEHMFFDEKRINVFREMVISDTQKERQKALNKHMFNIQHGD